MSESENRKMVMILCREYLPTENRLNKLKVTVQEENIIILPLPPFANGADKSGFRGNICYPSFVFYRMYTDPFSRWTPELRFVCEYLIPLLGIYAKEGFAREIKFIPEATKGSRRYLNNPYF